VSPRDFRVRLGDAWASAEDDALDVARKLADDLTRVGGPASMQAEAHLLVATRAREERRFDAGLAAVQRVKALDPSLSSRADRLEGALLLGARRVDEGLALLQATMGSRVSLRERVMASRYFGVDDPLDAALDEAATIALWASHATPEWVRALGGVEERMGEGVGRLGEALAAMVESSAHPVSDLEVVTRQAGQRGFRRTALAAAEVLAARFGDSLDAASIAGPVLAVEGQSARASALFERAGDAAPASDDDKGRALLRAAELARATNDLLRAGDLLARARPFVTERDALRVEGLALDLDLARGAPGALERGLARLDEVANDPRMLAETAAGISLVEVLVEALLARRDRRALDVQQKLVEAKRTLWGECPALAMEEHNLATIRAALGDRDGAIVGLTDALRRLSAVLGDEHPNVALARRSLARLDPNHA